MRILFVDDESMILDGIRRSFFEEEWDMHFVTSGDEALEILAEVTFDVVVTDMRMPGMNGMELLSIVQQRHPDVTRIVLSGCADAKTYHESREVADHWLDKPCDPELLRSVLVMAYASRLQEQRNVQQQ